MKNSLRSVSFIGILVLLAAAFGGIMPVKAETIVLINEVDADQVSTDSAEFVELYDGGVGNTSLTGLSLVLYNGSDNLSYVSFDLDGQSTDGNGYFVLCGNAANVANCDLDVSPDTNLIQNGEDAVALLVGDAVNYPNDTALPADGDIVDAIVYETGSDADSGLLVLLNAGQPQVNEDGAGDKDNHSNQRCPNGSGGALNTDTYAQFDPTPGTENDCSGVVVDTAPSVATTTPFNAAAGVAINANIEITFNEAVDVIDPWFGIVCSVSGSHTAAFSGGLTTFTLDPDVDFDNSETCTVTVIAAQVTDIDNPPDNMEADFSFSYSTEDIVVIEPPEIIITEIMYDPNSAEDDWEWIEIYNAGDTTVDLEGFVIDDKNTYIHSSANITSGTLAPGELDGDGHPHVGLMVAQVWDPTDEVYVPLWRCSGTLLSETIFLTAGHCTEAPADHVEIWFDTDVESGIPANGYPFTGDVGGTPYTHPDYYDYPWFTHDVGVVVLDESVPMDEYGVLPEVDQLDVMKTKRGKQDTTFTAVGYGLQQINPVFVQDDRVRMVATPRLIQINVPGMVGDFSLLLSNNHSTGGTCFGDSGGPNFLFSGDDETNIVAGVTSFGLNGNCAGTGGVFRMDRANVIDWVNSCFDGVCDQ